MKVHRPPTIHAAARARTWVFDQALHHFDEPGEPRELVALVDQLLQRGEVGHQRVAGIEGSIVLDDLHVFEVFVAWSVPGPELRGEPQVAATAVPSSGRSSTWRPSPLAVVNPQKPKVMPASPSQE